MRILVSLVVLLVALAGIAAWVLSQAGTGAYGELVEAGEPIAQTVDSTSVEARTAAQASTAEALRVHAPKQILFGDLHVHSSFSVDAFQLTMPMTGGEGTHPVADACDFARFCSNLDFWSINDHAASLTPRRWQETIETIRRCDAIGGEEPDLVSSEAERSVRCHFPLSEERPAPVSEGASR